MRSVSRERVTAPWWMLGPALGAVVMYLIGAAYQLATGRALDTIVWPPFVLLMAMMGAFLGLLTEGTRRLAGGVGWAVGISLCLFPTLMLAISLIQASRTPGTEFRWHDFLPFALAVELFVIAYWGVRSRMLPQAGGG